MARIPSTMLELGTPLPSFSLTDVRTNQLYSSDAIRKEERGRLVMFICNHCPFVVHIRPKLVEVAHKLLESKLGVVAINSNSAESHPQDGPVHMKALAETEGWRFPFLFDETQEVAKAFRAACTPDLYLFDGEGRLYYRGQFDGSRPGNGVPVTGSDLSGAAASLLAGQSPPEHQSPSIGCNIKWKAGNEPSFPPHRMTGGD